MYPVASVVIKTLLRVLIVPNLEAVLSATPTAPTSAHRLGLSNRKLDQLWNTHRVSPEEKIREASRADRFADGRPRSKCVGIPLGLAKVWRRFLVEIPEANSGFKKTSEDIEERDKPRVFNFDRWI